jgi:AcrR family transcriptional regulator
MEVATAPEGLRASKKRRTRDSIASAAMQLFRERGYDAVTVAEVAAAADVSEKTVFNYFPAKEDLVFERGQDRRAALIAAILERPAGASVVEPFLEATLAFLDRVEHDPAETTVAVPRLVMASPTLRDRLFVGWEREAEELSPVIAAAAGAAEDDLTARVVARSLAWTNRLVFRAAVTRLIAGEDRRVVASELRADARRAYRQLEQGLAGYGERRP